MDLSSQSVYLKKCRSYNEQELAACLDDILSHSLPGANLHSEKILLKPNLITARMGPLACTEGVFMLAVAQWFLKQGAHVSIGDSPAFGTTTSVLQKLGILDTMKKLPVRIKNFNKVVQVSLPSGVKAGIASDAFDCDLLVNLPRIKAHAQLRVTLSVKNLFGCLVGMRKPLWHMKFGGCGGRFAEYLVEILSVLPDGITIVDGIEAMHGTGPIGGKPFPLGLVAVSTNPVAVDRCLLSILGVPPELSPLMHSCIKKNLPGSDIDTLDFPMLPPAALAVDTFVVPEELNPIRFNPFRFLKGSIKRMLLKMGSSS